MNRRQILGFPSFLAAITLGLRLPVKSTGSMAIYISGGVIDPAYVSGWMRDAIGRTYFERREGESLQDFKLRHAQWVKETII